MKILMLTPYLPYPLISGGQIRTYNLLKNLAEKHEITLFSYIRSEDERKHKKELLKYCEQVHMVRRRSAWSGKNIMLSGFTPYPFLVCLYLSRGLKKHLAELVARTKFDLIHAETFYVMPQLPSTKIPTLLVEQTIEWMVYKRYVEESPYFPLKPMLYFDVLKIKYWEKYFWKKATRLVTVSQDDKQVILNTIGNKKIDVVANGVDIDFFASTAKKKSDSKTILFVGNFKWLPNSDAAIYLVNEVWPKIRKVMSQAKLWIVGKNPTSRILDLAKTGGVKVTSDLDDIRDAFAGSDLMLAPIRNGRGTKYKVIEAVATKTPVVATSLAVEGLNLVDNHDVLVGNSAESLADKAIEILQNPKLGQKIANNAYKILKDKYNWEVISGKLDQIYKEMGQTLQA